MKTLEPPVLPPPPVDNSDAEWDDKNIAHYTRAKFDPKTKNFPTDSETLCGAIIPESSVYPTKEHIKKFIRFPICVALAKELEKDGVKVNDPTE